MDRRRFQNLEKARPERRHPEAPEEDPLAAARLETIEQQETQSTSVQTGLSRERFEEPPIPLATVAPDEPLFHRCHICGADNQRSDVSCQHCSADLRTAAQEAFDAKLLQKERDEQRRERERDERPLEQVRGDAERQAELGKAFTELFAEERGQSQPLGWRWLSKLPNPWRWIAIGGIALCYVFLFWTSERTIGWFWIWVVAGFGGLLLFTPPTFWTRTIDRRGRWL